MKLRDVCPCRLGTFPEVIMTTGMSLICTEGHRVILSFNYIPEVLRKDRNVERQQVSKMAMGEPTEKLDPGKKEKL